MELGFGLAKVANPIVVPKDQGVRKMLKGSSASNFEDSLATMKAQAIPGLVTPSTGEPDPSRSAIVRQQLRGASLICPNVSTL
jgi:hypothetical protein